jgi:hypothetical protein
MSALGDQGRLQDGENPQVADNRDITIPIVTVKAHTMSLLSTLFAKVQPIVNKFGTI